jgi:hypothetical protein
VVETAGRGAAGGGREQQHERGRHRQCGGCPATEVASVIAHALQVLNGV